MKKIALTLAAVSALGLAACTGGDNEANTVSNETEATVNEAESDTDNALDAAGNALDSVGNTLENATETVGEAGRRRGMSLVRGRLHCWHSGLATRQPSLARPPGGYLPRGNGCTRTRPAAECLT